MSKDKDLIDIVESSVYVNNKYFGEIEKITTGKTFIKLNIKPNKNASRKSNKNT